MHHKHNKNNNKQQTALYNLSHNLSLDCYYRKMHISTDRAYMSVHICIISYMYIICAAYANKHPLSHLH